MNSYQRIVPLLIVSVLAVAVLACGARIATEEIIERVETGQGVKPRRTVRVYRVTPIPPLEDLVKIGKVEADEQIEIVGVEITPGVGPPGGCRGPVPCPPRISFMVVATSRNHGPAGTIRTQITIEDPLTGETHTTHVDEFVEHDAQTGPHLGFIVEPKRWIARVEVRVVR